MKRDLLRRVVIACLLVELGASACAGPGGCCGDSAETTNYEHAYANAISHELAGFQYHRPIAEAWPEVVGVLSEFGYVLDEKEPVEGRTLQTNFKPAPNGHGAHRILLRVIRIDATAWRLTIDKQHQTPDGDGGTSLSIELHAAAPEIDKMAWTLAQRVEPQRTMEIERKVREKAERAGAVGRGCDRGCAACASLFVPESRSQ